MELKPYLKFEDLNVKNIKMVIIRNNEYKGESKVLQYFGRMS